MNINSIIVSGRVGNDIELRRILDGGEYKANINLAISESYKKENEWQTKTTWIQVEVWSKLAELVSKNVKKGVEIVVEGQIKNNDYTTKDGKDVKGLKILASKIHFERVKPEAKPETTSENYRTPFKPTEDEEDVPFN